MVPQVKPGPDGGVLRRASCKSTHDLQSPLNKREKNCTHGAQARPEQRHSCHLVCDSSDGLLLGGWERYTEVAKRGGQHTLPALSRATAPTDPNYIILAPLNPGSQVWTAGSGKVKGMGPCVRPGKDSNCVGRSLQGAGSAEQGGRVSDNPTAAGMSWAERAGPEPGVSQNRRLHPKRNESFVSVCTFPQWKGLLCVVGGKSPITRGKSRHCMVAWWDDDGLHAPRY